MFGLGTTELVVILVIVMILFGAGKLPEIGSGIGKGIRNFKRATRGEEDINVTPERSLTGPEALGAPDATKSASSVTAKDTTKS